MSRDAELEGLLSCFDDQASDMVALTKRIGVDAMRVVCEVLGMRKVHVPSFDGFVRATRRRVRDEELRVKYRGDNLGELAAQYDLSEERVLRIVSGKNVKRGSGEDRTKPLRASPVYHTRITAIAARTGAGMREVVDCALRIGLSAPDFDAELKTRYGRQRGTEGPA